MSPGRPMARRSVAKVEPTHRDTRRRFEQWAKNPLCEANTLSAVHGVPMPEVARREGLETRMGQSPFALARGQNFERRIFRSGGARLGAELQSHEMLPGGDFEFVDLRLRATGGPMADLDRAQQATLELLRRLVSPDPPRPVLAAGPALLVPGGIMLPEALLVIDALVAKRVEGKTLLVVGEIKTYPDRGGHTDPAELAQARAQAGVYVHALRLVAQELALADHLTVSDQGFLVLSRPGSNFPSVRPSEDLRYQALRAERGFALLSTAAQALPPQPETARIEGILSAETCYAQGCLSFCDRAPGCHRRALESGDPAVLGQDVEQLLGRVDLDRAIELMEGGRAETVAEEDLVRILGGLAALGVAT